MITTKKKILVLRLELPFTHQELTNAKFKKTDDLPITNASFDSDDCHLYVLMSNQYCVFEIDNDSFRLAKKVDIFGLKYGYFLNYGFNLMIKREKDWIIYNSYKFEKLQRIDKRKIKTVVTCNN